MTRLYKFISIILKLTPIKQNILCIKIISRINRLAIQNYYKFIHSFLVKIKLLLAWETRIDLDCPIID